MRCFFTNRTRSGLANGILLPPKASLSDKRKTMIEVDIKCKCCKMQSVFFVKEGEDIKCPNCKVTIPQKDFEI